MILLIYIIKLFYYVSDKFENLQSTLDLLKTSVVKLEKSTNSALKNNAILLQMLNNSNLRLCKAIEAIDQKLQTIMKADSRVRALALPIPALPPAFINLLPVNNIDQLEIVEDLLAVQSDDDGLKNMEELVMHYYLFILIL